MLEIFRELLNELRQEKNLSTKELDRRIGATSSTISKWEACKQVLSMENLYSLATFFNVSFDFLMGLEN